MMKNEQDNHQKQMTELIKNRDDNETKLLIERLKVELAPVQSSEGKLQSPDLTPQLQQLNATLDQIGKQQTNEALMEVMNGLRATVEQLGRPKMIIRDAQGRAQGVQ